mmetsp:Transcript_16490/g.35674  ORF Transcript_16490/g.35674 Transcript_16490/m.35674 type:complete len:264 (+) Transcript_16490:830-1621(+)
MAGDAFEAPIGRIFISQIEFWNSKPTMLFHANTRIVTQTLGSGTTPGPHNVIRLYSKDAIVLKHGILLSFRHLRRKELGVLVSLDERPAVLGQQAASRRLDGRPARHSREALAHDHLPAIDSNVINRKVLHAGRPLFELDAHVPHPLKLVIVVLEGIRCGTRVGLPRHGHDPGPPIGTGCAVRTTVGTLSRHVDIVVFGIRVEPLDVHFGHGHGPSHVDIDPLGRISGILAAGPPRGQIGIVDGHARQEARSHDGTRLGARQL